jgi:hypothetical protein
MLSVISIWERIIRRQQYLDTPKLSRTFFGSSPEFTRVVKSSHLSLTTLPHVKQRTGIINSIRPPKHNYDLQVVSSIKFLLIYFGVNSCRLVDAF